VSWCRQGPPGAAVEQVHAEWSDARHEFREFRVK
jgi:acylphosphatase